MTHDSAIALLRKLTARSRQTHQAVTRLQCLSTMISSQPIYRSDLQLAGLDAEAVESLVDELDHVSGRLQTVARMLSGRALHLDVEIHSLLASLDELPD